MSDISLVRLFPLKKIRDRRGKLAIIEGGHDVPFEIKTSYLDNEADISIQSKSYASINNDELIIALSGSIEITIKDGDFALTVLLTRPDYGVFIPRGLWHEQVHKSANSTALVFSSGDYDDETLIDYENYLKWRNSDGNC